MGHGLRTSLLTLLGAAVLGWALPRHILHLIVRRLQDVWAFVRRPRIFILVIWLVALIPMVRQTYVVRHYGVNVPIFDDWAMAPLIVKAHNGTLKLADVFQQQQEARTVLPNLIFILSSRGEWNVRDQMAVSLIGCWLTAVGLFVLLRRSNLTLAAVAICFWLMVLALFSPAAFELWIFASGFPSFLPAFFLVTALVVTSGRTSTLSKFVLCVLLAAASTFTLAHGLLAWGLTFPSLLVAERTPRWRTWLGFWLLATVICAAIYFWGYEKPPSLPRFGPPVSLLTYVAFILQFLGGGLAYSLKHQPSTAATIFGSFQVAVVLFASSYTVRRFRDRAFVASVVPWFVLALLSIGSAMLAALGRVEYGASYALASRYVPFSVGLTFAVIALLALVLNDWAPAARRPRWPMIAAGLLIVAWLVPYRVAAGNTLYFLRNYCANNYLARGALHFSPVMDTTAVIKKNIFPPGPEHVVANAAALDDLKLLRPPLARSNLLDAIPHEDADRVRVAGACETVRAEGENYRAAGWAQLKAKGRPPDGVVVSCEVAGAAPTLMAISNSVEMRWDIARISWPNDYLWTGWTATFPRSAVPPGAKLAFWAFDADAGKLYRLPEVAESPGAKR
jgi:hypothetical protein